LIRFQPTSTPTSILIGQPTSASLDIGTALLPSSTSSSPVTATVFSGSSILRPGTPTSTMETVHAILSPLSAAELGGGCIRCIGLNYRAHAAEAKMDVPAVPPLFLKPATALAHPWPTATVPLARQSVETGSGDYESELAVVLGTEARNVSEEDAMAYVLGYTAANDVSCRAAQFEQSQFCYSKGFDGGCPLGPTLVSTSAVPDPKEFKVRGLKNGKEMQPPTPISDLVFSIPKLISFLSQSTTLPAGTVILTGTPAGVGFKKNPPETLRDGDVFAVEILPHIGTLYSKFENEK
ncbi:MAG: hypothetical protein LQ340_005054, partial [Diploschistes diacapsis]